MAAKSDRVSHLPDPRARSRAPGDLTEHNCKSGAMMVHPYRWSSNSQMQGGLGTPAGKLDLYEPSADEAVESPESEDTDARAQSANKTKPTQQWVCGHVRGDSGMNTHDHFSHASSSFLRSSIMSIAAPAITWARFSTSAGVSCVPRRPCRCKNCV